MTKGNYKVVKLGKSKYLWFILISMVIMALSFAMSIETSYAETVGTNTYERTEAEIIQFMELNPSKYDKDKSEVALPTYKEDRRAALNMVKTARYIAGVPEDIIISDAFNSYSQKAVDACVLNGKVDHDLGYYTDDCLLAYAGIENCSLRWSVLDGWLEDPGENNKGVLGHRRLMLNPSLNTVGFGYQSTSKGTYSSMYIKGTAETSIDMKGVMWPSRVMPVSYFRAGTAWSYSYGDILDESDIEVVMTKDNQSWHFSKLDQTYGSLFVENTEYGLTGCVIWEPKGITSYNDGDSYHITISMISTKEIIADYDVNFFDSDNYLAPENFRFSSLTIQEDYYPYLKWTESKGATCYQIYRQEAGTPDWQCIDDDYPTYYGKTYLDTSAKKGIKYNYKIIAIREVNGVSYGKMADAPYPIRAISVPLSIYKLNFKALSAYSKKVNKLTWKTVANATGYKVYRRVYGKKTWTLMKTVKGQSVSTYKDTKAKSRVKYQYRVRAYRETNGVIVYGKYSSIRTVTTK